MNNLFSIHHSNLDFMGKLNDFLVHGATETHTFGAIIARLLALTQNVPELFW